MTIAFLNKLIEPEKSLHSVLASITGLNIVSSTFILQHFGFKNNVKVRELDEEILKKIEQLIFKFFFIEDEKKNINKEIIKQIITSNSRRGIRHTLKLPVNGQRTHTNARTRKEKKNKNKKGKEKLTKNK